MCLFYLELITRNSCFLAVHSWFYFNAQTVAEGEHVFTVLIQFHVLIKNTKRKKKLSNCASKKKSFLIIFLVLC